MGRALGEREFRVLYVSDKQRRAIEFSLLLIPCELKVLRYLTGHGAMEPALSLRYFGGKLKVPRLDL